MQSSKLQIYSCGILIITTFLGEQIKLFSIPLYCYFIITTAILLVIKQGSKVRIKRKICLQCLSNYSFFWIIVASILLIFSIKVVGIQPYLNCIITALIIIVIDKVAVDTKSTEILFKFALFGLIFTCFVCTLELLTGVHYIYTDEYYFRLGLNNTFGFQVNINDNASLLVICLFVPLCFIQKNEKRLSFVLLNFIVIVWSLCLILRIGSRAAIMAVIVGILVAIFAIGLSFLSRRTQKAGLSFVLGACIVVVIIFFLFNDTESLMLIISNPLAFASDMARLSFLRDALGNTDVIGFLIGNGAGITQNSIGNSIHSVFVEVLCDYGVFVFAWLCFFVASLFFSITTKLKLIDKMYFSSFSICFIIVGFCVSSMLRIRTIWAIFTLVYAQLKLKERVYDEE